MTTNAPATGFDDGTVEALLAGNRAAGEPQLEAVLAELRRLGAGAAPRPSEALIAAFDHGLTLAPALPARRSRRRVAAGVAAAVTLLFGSIVGAAAANALPGTAQRAVAAVVERLTPIKLPRPGGHGGTRPDQVPTGVPENEQIAPTIPASPNDGPADPHPEVARTPARPPAPHRNPTTKTPPVAVHPETDNSRDESNSHEPSPENTPSTDRSPAPEETVAANPPLGAPDPKTAGDGLPVTSPDGHADSGAAAPAADAVAETAAHDAGTTG